MNQLWSKYKPLPNDPQSGDQYKHAGIPFEQPSITSDFGVVRLDHDFGDRNHFMVSDRYYTYDQ